MDIVDSHTHVISADERRYPPDPVGGRRSTWSRERPVDVEGLLRAIDDAGVATAVVVQASTVYGHDNRLVADAVAAHPDRFVGVYSIDALAPDAPATIDRWQGEGLAGFRLFTTGTTMPGQADWLGHEDSYPAWAHAERLGIPVCLQMTMDGLPALRQLLEAFPGVRVLLDHCARPDLSDGPPYAAAQPLFDLAAFPGVHLKITDRALTAAATGAATPASFLDRLIATFGVGRLAWGSNFPAAERPLPALLASARDAFAVRSPDEQRALLGGTASALYAVAGRTRA